MLQVWSEVLYAFGRWICATPKCAKISHYQRRNEEIVGEKKQELAYGNFKLCSATLMLVFRPHFHLSTCHCLILLEVDMSRSFGALAGQIPRHCTQPFGLHELPLQFQHRRAAGITCLGPWVISGYCCVFWIALFRCCWRANQDIETRIIC